LKAQIAFVKQQHERDLANGYGLDPSGLQRAVNTAAKPAKINKTYLMRH
jgi:hypothetical protein